MSRKILIYKNIFNLTTEKQLPIKIKGNTHVQE